MNKHKLFDPSVYTTTRISGSLRRKHFPCLHDHTYLDYTGAGIPSRYQYREHRQMLEGNLWGNPHTNSPASTRSTIQVELARAMILEYFHATSEEYSVVFTPNATGALRIIGESYPFSSTSHLLLTDDNHNSVNGLREYALKRLSTVTYVPLTSELRINETQLYKELSCPGSGNDLFIYPAQSNFTGIQHPLDWISDAQSLGWDVVLDAAAFVPTNILNLSVHQPEAVTLSFYKMFGYPTGIGCMIAKNEFLMRLTPPTFSGGTIQIVAKDWYQLTPELTSRFEYGTINYQSVFAIPIGLRFLKHMNMEVIHTRVQCLTGWILDELPLLFHSNGQPLIELYGPKDLTDRGGTIAFNLLDPTGAIIPLQYIEEAMERFDISVRTGCFCNPGDGGAAFHANQHVPKPEQPFPDISTFVTQSGAKAEGAVRVSLGAPSNLRDCKKLLLFLKSFSDVSSFGEKKPRTSC